MKCSLCGATTYISYGSSLSNYAGARRELPMLDITDLNKHKKQAHPEVVKASRDKAAATKRERLQAAQDLHERKTAAGLAVSRLVIRGNRNAEGVISTLTNPVVQLSTLDKWDAQNSRYPEPSALGRYQKTEAQIAALRIQARQQLLEAYQGGQPVPVEYWEKIQAVMEKVT